MTRRPVRIVSLVVLGVVALLLGAFAWLGIPATAAGLAAKTVCSGIFVAGRPREDVIRNDLLPASALLHLAQVTVDEARQQVRGRMLWSRERRAMRLPGLGCVLDPTPQLLADATSAAGQASAEPAASGTAQVRRVAHPAADAAPWAAAERQDADREALEAALDEAFRNDAEAAGRNTRAVVILRHGRLVAERYAPGFDAATRQIGWSMTKTVLGVLVHARLAQQQRDATMRALDWVPPDRRPAWLADWGHDRRGETTVADLLFMRDGLTHEEGYAPWSAVPRMLWGGGDVAAYAGSAPSQAAPGQRFRYLSATTNLLSGLLRLQFDDDRAYWAYPRRTLFGPIGADSAVLEADATGNFVASSYLWATPRDWARIGQSLLDDGAVAGRQVFPRGWQRFATPPPSDDPAAMAYGAQVWLPGRPQSQVCAAGEAVPPDTLMMSGHWGQLVAIIPSRQAVIVRLGMTTDRSRFSRCGFVRDIVDIMK